MNRIKAMLFATISTLSLLLSMAAHAESVTNEEYQAVVKTAYNYFNGAANGDQELLSNAFDLEFGHVKMIGVNKDTGAETIRTVPLKEFAGFFKTATKDTWKAKILSVDIVDDKMAMVKLDFKTSKTSKTHYIDYLVMYKRDSHWRIVNKTLISKKR